VRSQLTDRAGRPLSVTYENAWNLHEVVAFHEVPTLLREAFVQAEDQRFYHHGGVDWIARAHAALQNLRAGRVVRGASTISEQSVRMLQPRPRTLWSRWIEGIQAGRLEARFSKAEILAFYLNQVPYARQRRGVAQAARDYFDRDLETLAPGEMLALAVLVRSPVRLDLVRGTRAIEAPLLRLAERMHRAGALSARELRAVRGEGLALTRPAPPVAAAHFVRFVRMQQATRSRRPARVTTTLDAALQERVQRLLDRRVERLRGRGVGDGAALVVDHLSGEILAWVDAGSFEDSEGGQIDAVLAPRQPGSTLKPLLYALAFEKGWSAATLVEDAPIADAVGHGLHLYRNYSRNHYGPLRVRLALGNSLNVPAVRAIRFVGRADFLERLRRAGVTSLRAHPDHYGDGLALGNGEVALLELVHAYATLARGGRFEPLRWTVDPVAPRDAPRRVYDPEVSALIADILADPEARELEFGRGGLLDFPVQTAVKTGTSNDYRDAWALGFSHRFTAGVWMGNLDRRPMQDVTGSRGFRSAAVWKTDASAGAAASLPAPIARPPTSGSARATRRERTARSTTRLRTPTTRRARRREPRSHRCVWSAPHRACISPWIHAFRMRSSASRCGSPLRPPMRASIGSSTIGWWGRHRAGAASSSGRWPRACIPPGHSFGPRRASCSRPTRCSSW
jgi:penicillin-binding protein 1C